MQDKRFWMVDLFSGLGGASEAARDRGWRSTTVDADPRFRPDVVADLSSWCWPTDWGRPDLLWASPPCTEFSRQQQPWCRARNARGGGGAAAPDLRLVRAAVRIIRAADPRFWVVENVKGAVPWLAALLGPPVQHHGGFFLWGRFPGFHARVEQVKQHTWGADRRARVPGAISGALVRAVEGAGRLEEIMAELRVQRPEPRGRCWLPGPPHRHDWGRGRPGRPHR